MYYLIIFKALEFEALAVSFCQYANNSQYWILGWKPYVSLTGELELNININHATDEDVDDAKTGWSIRSTG